ncbi:MAG: hypothetical protein JOZ39_08440 [Chloroflexi bacterium]|nr:hypothetical protein [Chloroflexota bacterium]
MEREAHLRLTREALRAYGQLIDYWDGQVRAKGAIGDWPSADLDRFSKEVAEPLKFLKEEIGRQIEELRRHDLGVSHNDFGDSGRARAIREAAAKLSPK